MNEWCWNIGVMEWAKHICIFEKKLVWIDVNFFILYGSQDIWNQLNSLGQYLLYYVSIAEIDCTIHVVLSVIVSCLNISTTLSISPEIEILLFFIFILIFRILSIAINSSVHYPSRKKKTKYTPNRLHHFVWTSPQAFCLKRLNIEVINFHPRWILWIVRDGWKLTYVNTRLKTFSNSETGWHASSDIVDAFTYKNFVHK